MLYISYNTWEVGTEQFKHCNSLLAKFLEVYTVQLQIKDNIAMFGIKLNGLIIHFEELWSETSPSVKNGGGESPLSPNVERALCITLQLTRSVTPFSQLFSSLFQIFFPKFLRYFYSLGGGA